MNLEEKRIRNIEEVLVVIPDSFGFKLVHTSESSFKLQNNACIIDFSFEHYESEKVTIGFFNPNKENDGCMDFLILRHLFHVNEKLQIGENVFHLVGRILTNYFADILRGDFSIQAEYKKIEHSYYDKVLNVLSLPSIHPARQKFDDFDIGWLDLMPE